MDLKQLISKITELDQSTNEAYGRRGSSGQGSYGNFNSSDEQWGVDTDRYTGYKGVGGYRRREPDEELPSTPVQKPASTGGGLEDYYLKNPRTGKFLEKQGVKSVFSSLRHAQAVAAKLKFGTWEPVPVNSTKEGVAEVTGDTKFDAMMTKISQGAKPSIASKLTKPLKSIGGYVKKRLDKVQYLRLAKKYEEKAHDAIEDAQNFDFADEKRIDYEDEFAKNHDIATYFRMLAGVEKLNPKRISLTVKKYPELGKYEPVSVQEDMAEAAKWRDDDREGKTWRSPDWDDGDLSPSKIKIDRSGKDVDDSGDELTSRPGMWRGKADMSKRMTKKGVPTKSELAFQDNLKMRMRMKKKQGGLTGPKGPLPEEQGMEEGYREFDELRDRIERILIKAYDRYGNRDEVINAAKPAAMKAAQELGAEKYFDEVWRLALSSHDVDTNFGDDDDDFDYTDYSMRQGERGNPDRFREQSFSEGCGDMEFGASEPPKQMDNVNMNVSLNASGSGGIKDLLDIIRNIESKEKDMIGVDDMPQAISKMGMTLDDDFANEPDETYAGIDAMTQTGGDLHSKGDEAPNQAGGGNPWNIKPRLESLYNEIKLREGSGPKEKQHSKYVDRSSPESKAKVQAAKDKSASDKAAEPGKKLLAKIKSK